MYNFVSHSEEETKNLATQFASHLSTGDIIILSGDLGSGKTKFVEGFLKYFALENEISSPTFTIVNEYSSFSFPIYHFDVYRLEDSEEFLAMGGTEYFDKGISIIEWGEKIEELLPLSYIKISFSREDSEETIRNLEIQPYGEKAEKLVKEILEN